MLSDVLLNQNRKKEALNAAHKARSNAITPSNLALAYSVLGNIHAKSERKALAERYYRKALQTNPDNVFRMLLGILLFDSDRTEEAKKFFESTIKSDPTYEEAYLYLGKYYIEKGNLKLAEENLKKAIELDPKYTEALSEYGFILLRDGRFKESRRFYAKAVKIDQKNVRDRLFLGLTLWKLRRLKDAKCMFESAIDLEPENDSIYWNNK